MYILDWRDLFLLNFPLFLFSISISFHNLGKQKPDVVVSPTIDLINLGTFNYTRTMENLRGGIQTYLGSLRASRAFSVS